MSIEKVVAALNAAFAADPGAMRAMMINRVPCNMALANDPYVVCEEDRNLAGDHFSVGTLGVINGVLAAAGMPLVAAKWDMREDGPNIFAGFIAYIPPKPVCVADQSPQPDQYWQHKTSGDRAYFIGRTPDGEMVWQCKGDTVEVGDLDWSDWEHLQGCDSWEWKPVAEPAVVKYPQWYVPVKSTISHEHGVRVAYLRRDSEKTGETFLVNGLSFKFYSVGFNPEELYVVTEDEAKSRVNQPVAVKAPSDIMGQSPDDWVPQVTMLPRTGIDQVKWTWNDGSISEWTYAQGRWDTATHGYCSESGGRLEVRCQRKHLGKVHNGIPVALYWYDGAIVGRYADSPVTDPSFVPIHSDGNGGWFIERSEDAGN